MTIPPLPVDPRLRTLQSEVAYPSVTLVLPTTPSRHLTDADRGTLEELSEIALRRLQPEVDRDTMDDMRGRLETTLGAAGAAGTDRGLAVLVSAGRCESIVLPFSPRRRVVVDPTFATRDLAAASARWPQYRVVVFSSSRFRVLEGRRRALADVEAPLGAAMASRPELAVRLGPGAIADRRRRGRTEAWSRRDRRAAEVLAAADAALNRRQDRQRLPLVVIGPARWTSPLVGRVGHRHDVIAVITGNHIDAEPAQLARLASPALDAWVAHRDEAVLADLRSAEGTGRLRWGLSAAWVAAISGQADHLWVADDYAPSGRLDDSGTKLTVTANRDAPGVIDDVVDDLIEIVHAMGGTAHQVPAAIFGEGGESVAVLVRSRRHHRRREPALR